MSSQNEKNKDLKIDIFSLISFLFVFLILIVWTLFLISRGLKIEKKNSKIEKDRKKNLALDEKIKNDFSKLDEKRIELQEQTKIFSQQIQANLKKEIRCS